MNILDHSPHVTAAISYAGVLEKIEILRSTLRWASRLERHEIEKLLRQSHALRDEVMQLSHKERFVTAAASQPSGVDRSPGERRKALLERSFVFEGTFGDNPKLLEALEIAEKAAPTDLPVLIDGESGTGKELMAKVIHANGARADRPSSRSTAERFPTTCSSPSCSGTRKAPSPARPAIDGASSRPRTAAPSSWTRSASCRCPGR